MRYSVVRSYVFVCMEEVETNFLEERVSNNLELFDAALGEAFTGVTAGVQEEEKAV